jgi:hypothetical protein
MLCALGFWELTLLFAAGWRQTKKAFAFSPASTAVRYDRTERNSGLTRYRGWRENEQARGVDER